MRLEDFDFELPQELIALKPARPRDSSKLLVVGGNFQDAIFSDITKFLRAGDVLVFNDSRTIPANLNGIRKKRDEISNDVPINVNLLKQINGNTWQAFAKPFKRLKIGDTIHFDELSALVTQKIDGGEVEIKFNLSGIELLNSIFEIGKMPLPPYIGLKRELDEEDKSDYQTIYSKHDGSVATPTAGLHFTDELFAKIDALGVKRAFVTLHVGAGTFLPVKTDNLEDHKMHKEFFIISEETAQILNQARQNNNRIICVGTTSLRSLESAYVDGKIMPCTKETDIFIYPGKKVHSIDAIITNFHLPKSSLLMLMGAFSGMDTVKAAYKHAIENNYRFFSYGDAGLWYNTSR